MTPDADNRKAARLRGGDDGLRVLVVDIDDRGAARFDEDREEPQLGGEVGLEAQVIVQMIARDVGESAGGNAQAVEAVLIEPMRGRLDRKMGDLIAGESVERSVQRDRIRRRQRAVGGAAGRDDTDSADARGAVSECGPDLPREGRDRGFSARAGDGDNDARLAREESGGHHGERAAGVVDTREGRSLRQRNLRPALGHDRRRAGSERGRDEGEPVRLAAGNRDERIAAPDRAAVSRHPGDVEIGVAGLDLRVCGQDVAKLHGGSVDVRPRLTCFPLSRPV